MCKSMRLDLGQRALPPNWLLRLEDILEAIGMVHPIVAAELKVRHRRLRRGARATPG